MAQYGSLPLFLHGLLIAACVLGISSARDDDLDKQVPACVAPTMGRYGMVRLSHGGRYAHFQCARGLMTMGTIYARCEGGRWTEAPPLCVANGCEEVLHLPNGKVSLSYRGAVVQFQCLKGYQLKGNDVIVCDGASWNASFPTCFDLKASDKRSDPSWNYGTMAATKWSKSKLRDLSPHHGMLKVSDYSCIKHEHIITPPRIANARAFTKWAVYLGSPRLYTVYRCTWEYSLVGTARNLYCQKAKWKGSRPLCIHQAKGENDVYRDQAEPGTLSHEAALQGADYTCVGTVERRQEVAPPLVMNAGATLRHKTAASGRPVLYAQYRCLPGYQLEESAREFMYCRNSAWTGELPKCVMDEEASCSRGNGGCLQLCTDAPSGEAVCGCHEGYELAVDGKSCKRTEPPL